MPTSPMQPETCCLHPTCVQPSARSGGAVAGGYIVEWLLWVPWQPITYTRPGPLACLGDGMGQRGLLVNPVYTRLDCLLCPQHLGTGQTISAPLTKCGGQQTLPCLEICLQPHTGSPLLLAPLRAIPGTRVGLRLSPGPSTDFALGPSWDQGPAQAGFPSLPQAPASTHQPPGLSWSSTHSSLGLGTAGMWPGHPLCLLWRQLGLLLLPQEGGYSGGSKNSS